MTGAAVGFALMFDRWEHTDGRVGRSGSVAMLPEDMPSLSEITDSQQSVDRQASVVRETKLTNPMVSPGAEVM